MGLFGLSLPKKVDNIIGAAQAQLNPFDGGQTYNTVRQGIQPASAPVRTAVAAPPQIGGNQPSLYSINGQGFAVNNNATLNQPNAVNQNDLSSKIAHIIGGVISPVTNTIGLGVNDTKLIAANVSHNKVAQRNAAIAGMQNVHGLEGAGQSILRTIPEALTSLTGTQRTYTPGSRVEKALFGQTPVQNIEKKVANNYDTHANLNPFERLALAAGEGVGSVAMDAPVVGTVGKLARLADATAAARGVDLGVGRLGMSTKSVGGTGDVLKQIHAQTVKEGGATTNLEGKSPKAGYAYAPSKDTELVVSTKDFHKNPKILADFARKNSTALKDPKNHIGTWDNPEDGNTYVDVSRVGRSSAKTISDAQKAQQLAVFDLKRFNTIDVGKMDKTGYNNLDEASNIHDNYQRQNSGASGSGIDSGAQEVPQQAQTGSQPAVAGSPAQEVAGSVPSEADFNKMIPAVAGKKVGGPTGALSKADVAQTDAGVKLGPQEVNTARNSFKSIRQNIKQGDWKAVVSNVQAITKPIDTIGGQWSQAMKHLSTDERANFWRAVEDPTNASHSPAMQNAISLWRAADDRIHANSQALGGNTNYLTNHALHPWQLPEEYTQHIINGGNPDKFAGLNNISRKYRTIAEGEANGLTLGTDPVGEGTRYLQASSSLLRRASLKQDIAQADSANATKSHVLSLGNGHAVPVSEEAKKALQGVEAGTTSGNAAIKSLRTANVGLKSTLLSGGQFHPINISLLRAAPTLVMTGHAVAAAKGLYGTFRGAFGTQYAQRVIGDAIKDGTVDKAAKIGMPYGGGGYDTGGSFLKGGVGHHTVFEKQMPMMHDQVARSILSDLEKNNVSLDSQEARDAGLAGNRLMGFINKEAQNISPTLRKGMNDWLLAGQFTPSKIGQVKAALTPGSYAGAGVAGKYAATSVAANVAATAAVITGIGFIGKQKSDNAKDLLLRALIDPAAPTGAKDSKGNNIKLRTPGTDTSDIAKLLGIKLVRQTNGHLGVSWNPHNLPSTVSDFARARLSPILSGGVKVATNSSFSNKPLFDPAAPAGTKTEQAATSLITGVLPIGAQGVPYVNAVKKHLPGDIQDVLNASSPGSNPIVKSVGSSFGLSPSTDTTVGKAQQTTAYFDQLNKAKSGLTSQDEAAFNSLFNSKKNPVSGKYDNPANVWDSGARATTLLDHPKVLDAAVKMNQALQAQGQTIDPLYGKNLTTKQRNTFLSYTAQTEPATRAEMRVENPWINDLNASRSKFFDALPPGDPNKPKAPIPYPTPSGSVSSLQNQYYGLSDPTQKAQFIAANPELANQFAAEDQYNRSVRDAKNLPQYDSYPTAPKTVQSNLDQYEALPKGPSRTAWIDSHPSQWSGITTYLTQTSLYNLQSSAQKAAFQQQGFDQKGLKAISSLGQYDIGKTTDANGNVIYAIAPGSGSGSGGYFNGNSSSGINVASLMKRIPVGGAPRAPYGGNRIPRAKKGRAGSKVAIKGRKNKGENSEKIKPSEIKMA